MHRPSVSGNFVLRDLHENFACLWRATGISVEITTEISRSCYMPVIFWDISILIVMSNEAV